MEPKHNGEATDHKSDASSATGTHQLVGRHCGCVPRGLGIVSEELGATLLLRRLTSKDQSNLRRFREQVKVTASTYTVRALAPMYTWYLGIESTQSCAFYYRSNNIGDITNFPP
jgi:hypothetical protein